MPKKTNAEDVTVIHIKSALFNKGLTECVGFENELIIRIKDVLVKTFKGPHRRKEAQAWLENRGIYNVKL